MRLVAPNIPSLSQQNTLFPLKDFNLSTTTMRQVALDERKLPAISNRFTTESSPFIDNSNSRERTYSLSEMYELLTDNGSNKFSADGVKQVEDNDVKEVQFDERKLSAAGSDTIGSTSRRDN